MRIASALRLGEDAAHQRTAHRLLDLRIGSGVGHELVVTPSTSLARCIPHDDAPDIEPVPIGDIISHHFTGEQHTAMQVVERGFDACGPVVTRIRIACPSASWKPMAPAVPCEATNVRKSCHRRLSCSPTLTAAACVRTAAPERPGPRPGRGHDDVITSASPPVAGQARRQDRACRAVRRRLSLTLALGGHHNPLHQ